MQLLNEDDHLQTWVIVEYWLWSVIDRLIFLVEHGLIRGEAVLGCKLSFFGFIWYSLRWDVYQIYCGNGLLDLLNPPLDHGISWIACGFIGPASGWRERGRLLSWHVGAGVGACRFHKRHCILLFWCFSDVLARRLAALFFVSHRTTEVAELNYLLASAELLSWRCIGRPPIDRDRSLVASTVDRLSSWLGYSSWLLAFVVSWQILEARIIWIGRWSAPLVDLWSFRELLDVFVVENDLFDFLLFELSLSHWLTSEWDWIVCEMVVVRVAGCVNKKLNFD